MTGPSNGRFTIEPSPDHPGWLAFVAPTVGGFNQRVLGPIRVRREDDGKARVQITPAAHHANVMDGVHGGALLGFIDMSLFAGLLVLTGRDPSQGVTLDLTNQFLAAARLDRPIDAVVEILRETGRLVFLRGMVEQDGAAVTAFQATVRKVNTAS